MMRSIASTNTQQSAAARELAERMQTISGRIEASTREIASAGDLIHDLSVKADEMGNLVRRATRRPRRQSGATANGSRPQNPPGVCRTVCTVTVVSQAAGFCKRR